MVTVMFEESPKTRDIIVSFRRHWINVFQAPATILTDRGSVFRQDDFRLFVTEFLRARLVYTSPYYPQGNAINEASHKAIEASLAASDSHAHARGFEAELADATMVYNSIPHVSTGKSPNYMMFGTELTLPGWQGYKQDTRSLKMRFDIFRLEKLQAQARAQISKDYRLTVTGPKFLEEGDWIIFQLSDYEQGATSSTPLAAKHQARWSLPALVKKVQATTCTVGLWGDFNNDRQVPYVQVRKLTGRVPPSLVRENITHIESAAPRRIKHWTLADPHASLPMEWKDLLLKAALKTKEGEAAESTVKKRQRRQASPVLLEPSASDSGLEEG